VTISGVRLKENYIRIHPEKCTGCNMCLYACALKHTGDTDPAGSRMIIVPLDGEKKGYVPLNCLQCAEPYCTEVCPTGAITRNRNGIVSINDDKCIGCLLCTLACPYGGARLDAQANMSMACDLCNGTPECVRLCPEGALEFNGIENVRLQLENSEDLMSKGVPLCAGCPAEMSLRFILRVLGKNTILYVPPSCATLTITGMGELPSCKIPSVHGFLTNSASFLTGVSRHDRRAGRRISMVVYAGDGGTADVGFQSLSGAAERNENIIYICNDNEGYMNTGVQRSGTTPYAAWTSTTPYAASPIPAATGEVGRGKRQAAKEMPWIMLTHGVPYVATGTVGFLSDLELKLRKAMATEGFSYIHLLNPCPTGWGFLPEKTITLARMAVKTNYFPLWEAENGRVRITVKIRAPQPVEEYVRLIGKYDQLDKEHLQELQRQVDHRYKRLQTAASVDRFF